MDKGNFAGLYQHMKTVGAIPKNTSYEEAIDLVKNSDELQQRYDVTNTVEDWAMVNAGRKVDAQIQQKKDNPIGMMTGIADVPTFGLSDEIADLLGQKELAGKMRKSKGTPAYVGGMVTGIPLTGMMGTYSGPGLMQNLGTKLGINIGKKAMTAGTTGKLSRIRQWGADTLLPSIGTGVAYGAGDPIAGDRSAGATLGGITGLGVPIGLKSLGLLGGLGASSLNTLIKSPKLSEFINKRLTAGQAGAQLERTGDEVLDDYLATNRDKFQGFLGGTKELQKTLNNADPADINKILTELGEGNPLMGIREARVNKNVPRQIAQGGRSKALLDAADELGNVAASPRADLYTEINNPRLKYNPKNIFDLAKEQTMDDVTGSLAVKPSAKDSKFIESKLKEFNRKLQKEFYNEYGIPKTERNFTEATAQKFDDWIGDKTKSMIREEPSLTSPTGLRTPEGDVMSILGKNLQTAVRNTVKKDPFLSNEGRAFQKGQDEVASNIMDYLPGKKKDIHKQIKGNYESYIDEFNKTADDGAKLSKEAHPTDALHTLMTKRGNIKNKEFDSFIDRVMSAPDDLESLITSRGKTPSFDTKKFKDAKQALKEQNIANTMSEYSPGGFGIPEAGRSSSLMYMVNELAKKTLGPPEFENYLMSRATNQPVFKETLADYLAKSKHPSVQRMSPLAKPLDNQRLNRLLTRDVGIESLRKSILDAGARNND